ncbi:hypothetical protein OIO90_005184 [Microbotryomycetes sp. JL221]|nr:hypothetical protein OIO90_005184 [Microbotryomycetes sp. JL221]
MRAYHEDVIWGGSWAIVYRKFFFDFVGGHLGPTGLIPSNNVKGFVSLIVDWPAFQVINIINGVVTIIIEYPSPLTSQAPRIIFYLWCAFSAVIVFQTVDAALFYLITVMIYARSFW